MIRTAFVRRSATSWAFRSPTQAIGGLACFCLALFATDARATDLETTKKDPTAAPASTELTPSPPTTLTPSPPIAAPASSATDKPRSTSIPRSKSPTRAASSASTAASDEPDEPPPPAAEPPRAAVGPLVTKSIAVGVGDLSIELDVPDDWPALPPRALPDPPKSDDPNAKDVAIVARKGLGFFAPDAAPPDVREVILVCATAPGELWADSIRDAAFTAMEVGVEKAIAGFTGGANVDVDAAIKTGDRYEQPFHADAPLSRDGLVDVGGVHHGKAARAPKVLVRGVSTIGFASEGPRRLIVACSIACAQLGDERDEGEKGVCDRVVASVRARGSWVAAPERSWLADRLFFLRNNPTLAWTGLIAIGVVLLACGGALVVVSRRRHATARDELDDDRGDDEEDADARPSVITPADDEGLEASPPPRDGYFDPTTLQRR